MKRILAIVLALVMVFALVACGQQAAPAGGSNQSTSQQGSAGSPKQDIADASPAEKPAETELKHVKMGLAMQSLQAAAFHAWADYLAYRLDYEAEQRGYEVELVTLNADNDVTKQATDIRDLIAQGCEVIFCPCLDSQAILSSVKEVHDAGLIYVSYCREVSHDAKGDEVPDLTVNFASEDQAYWGMVDLFDIMKEDGVEPVKIIDCYGDKTDENAHNREKGLQRAIKEYGYENVPIVEAECGHWEPDVCGQNLAPVLAANPDANCMYSSSDFLSSGIQKAMEDAGMWHKHGEEGHVYFSASDLYPLGIQHLREGYMDTGVDQGCYNFAVHAAAGAFDLLEGKEVEPVQLVLGTRATYKDIEEILKTIPLWGNDYADY
jgi:ABC-type sugar transport system substrate-binding protein